MFISHLGGRFGLWSTPGKEGLLPYEEPSFQAVKDFFVDDAFAC